ncbi:hypothetical protein SAMN05216229_11232 [Geopseudomonas sagittaria]|uniref:Uncharacterized protein n=2 Tax=Geopseudomonas sagittaria TaxID=1135990 RepID=A0A1I5W253_9GAMM|nr:hypothetical protein SAMN05216229_11232 [Pseudomonas sagittaria]
MEAEMEQLENEQNKLIATRAADVVVSKEDFFRKLDLVSYGGRSAANNLLKRLHIKVMVEKRGRSDERYQIVDATGRLHVTLFYVEHVGADVAVDTTNAQFADVMVMQGEMNEEDAERLQYAPEEF